MAGNNFGTGDHGAHAVWALIDYGFQAVLSPRLTMYVCFDYDYVLLMPEVAEGLIEASLARGVELVRRDVGRCAGGHSIVSLRLARRPSEGHA